jgi:hypothetical protein
MTALTLPRLAAAFVPSLGRSLRFAAGRRTFLALVLTCAALATAGAQKAVRVDTIPADSARLYAARLTSGTTVVGRIDDPRGDPLVIQTENGTLTIPRARIAELRAVATRRLREGVYWPPNPNETRLLFAPTGRMLKPGEGYYSNTYLFLQQFAGGMTSRFTLGGGFSIFPSDDFFSNNVFYVTPKVGVYNTERTNVAVGALAAFVPGEDTDGTFGIAYGVATFGSPDAQITTGAGFGYAQGRFAQDPVLMVGGEKRLSRRTAFISENYIFPAADETNNFVSYGLRFFGDRLSVDFALINTLGDEMLFPGVPYVAFAVKF